MCDQKPFACAYTLRHMLVANLWLWGGCPAPGLSSELMGATPPFWDASIGIGEGWHVQAHANPPPGGRSRSNDPLREGRRADERPTPRCLTTASWDQPSWGLTGCVGFPRTGGERSRSTFAIAGGLPKATRLDDRAPKPQATYRLRAGPHKLELSIEVFAGAGGIFSP